MFLQYVLECEQWHDRLEAVRKEELRDGRKDRFSAWVLKSERLQSLI